MHSWQQFAEHIRQQNRQIEYLILKEPPQLDTDTNQVTVSLHNPIQEDRFQELKAQAQQYLHQQLRNNSIRINGVMDASSSKRLLYTNQEKFDYLVEKHPQLMALRQRLGLEPD